MKKITKQDVIDSVLDRWLIQYPEKDETKAKWEVITERLRNEKPKTVEEVHGIIGNFSWTLLYCHNCATDVEVVIAFRKDENGFKPDDTELRICLDCLKKAKKLIK